jgi:pilus assembly protein CpaF
MGQDPKRKFPAAIPNPAAVPPSLPQTSHSQGHPQAPALPDDGPTDPNISLVIASDPEPMSRSTVLKANMPDLGILESFMKDPDVSEVMVNDLRNIMIEKEGKLLPTRFTFKSIEELNRVVMRILQNTGKMLTPDIPYVDAMLPDGSRVNIVGPPLTVGGPCITIRKFPSRQMTIQDLMARGMIDQTMSYFLNLSVLGRMNILISGGAGSGKTTLLNVLAGFVPKSERIITIEDTAELSIHHPNSVRMQTKLQSPTSGPITARDLVANALRMRPDRIIVGECRRGETFDMLQAMNTGHSGSMTTLHSNSPRDALYRLETLCLMGATEVPISSIRKQIASTLDLVVHIKRFRSGKRRVVAITEITGIESETITTQDIYSYEVDARDASADSGRFKFTGYVPTFLDRLREQGIEIPKNFFSN